MPRFSSTLREHATYPSNQGEISNANGVGRASVSNNPPFVSIFLRIENDIVNKAGFESQGCGVTTAVCSSITEMIENRTIAQCKLVKPEEVAESLDGIPADKMHCATVVVGALNNAINDYLDKQGK